MVIHSDSADEGLLLKMIDWMVFDEGVMAQTVLRKTCSDSVEGVAMIACALDMIGGVAADVCV